MNSSPRPRGITLAPPQRAPQPRNQHGSWWQAAPRAHFTELATKSLTPETLSAGASMALSPWPGQREEGP